MEKSNPIIREALKSNGFKLWNLQEILDVSESSVTRLMRKKLSDSEQMKIAQLIQEAAHNAE